MDTKKELEIALTCYITEKHNQDRCTGFIEGFKKAAEVIKNNDNIPVVMPRISHFIDENGNSVDVNAGGVNAKLKRDGTFEYYRSFGFAGRKELTPVYGA